MENNNKSNEELADEALDKVAGGQEEAQGTLFCSKCRKFISTEQLNCHDGHYYCPDCGKQLA